MAGATVLNDLLTLYRYPGDDWPRLMTTDTPSIDAVIAGLIETFDALGDWDERYRHIIRLGQRLPPLPEELRTDAHRIHGCQSHVWLASRYEHGVMRYRAASDAMIVSGLIALLLAVYDGRSPAEVVGTSPGFLRALGLSAHLSPMRSNGLHHMVLRIQRDGQEALSRSAAASPAGAEPGDMGGAAT